MGRASVKIAVSVLAAGAVGFCVLVMLEAMLPGGHGASPGNVLFRFQLSSMIAMAIFAGLAVVIYIRLSRSWPNAPAARQSRRK